MMPNGNYEEVISYIQHSCRNNHDWHCYEYSSNMGQLFLKIEEGDPYEDGCSYEIEVEYCPFCGQKSDNNKK